MKSHDVLLNEPCSDEDHQGDFHFIRNTSNREFDALTNGDSSFWQTTFNMTNVIMGVGILALPKAFQIGGWLVPIFLLTLFAFTASTTAKILAVCQRHYLLMTGTPLLTYGDLSAAAFGWKGRLIIQAIFISELFMAEVAMLLMVSNHVMELMRNLVDSESVPRDFLVTLCVWAILTMSTWPKTLRLLSYSSVVGVVCMAVIVGGIVFDGFYAPSSSSSGSIFSPAETYLLPPNWMKLPLVIGLCMVGFSGHACFPGLYASMGNSAYFAKVTNISFTTGLAVYLFVSSLGFLMFGVDVKNMITYNLSDNIFPSLVSHFITGLVIINAASKYPLLIFPIVNEIELFLARRFSNFYTTSPVDNSQMDEDSPLLCSAYSSSDLEDTDSKMNTSLLISPQNQVYNPWYRSATVHRIFLRTSVSATVLAVSVALPRVEQVLSLLGALFAITTSILFPLLCYLAFFKPPFEKWPMDYNRLRCVDSTAPGWKRFLALLGFILFASLAVVGTVWTVLPEALLEPR